MKRKICLMCVAICNIISFHSELIITHDLSKLIFISINQISNSKTNFIKTYYS